MRTAVAADEPPEEPRPTVWSVLSTVNYASGQSIVINPSGVRPIVVTTVPASFTGTWRFG